MNFSCLTPDLADKRDGVPIGNIHVDVLEVLVETAFMLCFDVSIRFSSPSDFYHPRRLLTSRLSQMKMI